MKKRNKIRINVIKSYLNDVASVETAIDKNGVINLTIPRGLILNNLINNNFFACYRIMSGIIKTKCKLTFKVIEHEYTFGNTLKIYNV